MSALLRGLWPAVLALALTLAAVLFVRAYGAAQYRAGEAAQRLASWQQQVRVERAMQEERDRADERYREAVAAREAAQADVADQRRRIDGLLRERAERRAAAAGAGGRPDDTGPDWIGVIAACVAGYERLGRDAAGWADQVNGLQDYVRALQPAAP